MKEIKICKVCGKQYSPRQKKPNSVCCSIPCRQKWNGIKGGQARAEALRGTGRGYGTPQAGYVKQDGRHQHRTVMEKMLGRPLVFGEVVHHLNGIKSDNRVKNLVLINQSLHATYHSTKNKTCTVKGCGRKHLAKGFCSRHYKKGVQWKD